MGLFDEGGGLGGLMSFLTGGGGDAPKETATSAPTFMPKEKEGGGIMDMLGPLLIGGGGALASHLLGRGADKDIKKASKGMRDVAGVTGPAKQMIERAAAGKLTDAQQAGVDRMKAEQNARWGQYLAQLGIPVSSAQVQSANLVDQEALKMANDLINTSWKQGMEAYGIANSANQALLSSAMAQRQDLSKTIWNVASQIGRVLNTPEEEKKKQIPTNASPYVPPEWSGTENAPVGAVTSISDPEGMGY